MHIASRIQKYRSKGKVFQNAGTIGFQMVCFSKKILKVRKMVLCWTLLKTVRLVGFSGKCVVSQSNVGCLGDCIVIAMIFSKKYMAIKTISV